MGQPLVAHKNLVQTPLLKTQVTRQRNHDGTDIKMCLLAMQSDRGRKAVSSVTSSEPCEL